MNNEKPHFFLKPEVEKATKYLADMDMRTTGAYVNGPCSVSLPYILASYAHDVLEEYASLKDSQGEKPDFICDVCKFTRSPHEHRCLDPANCKCEDCRAVREYADSLRQQSQIPEWIIEYDKKGYQSAAGKAIRILLNMIKGLPPAPEQK